MASLLPNERLRSAVAERVGRHLGRAWRPVRVQDKSESASHAAAILSDGTYAVFVKLATSATARDQFEREAAGLRFLTRRSGVLTPTVIGIAEGEGAVALIMEAVRTVERGPREWRQMGRALARIHAVQADRFGFHAYNYWGDLRQENSPAADWAEFFWTNRIAPTAGGGRRPPDTCLWGSRCRWRVCTPVCPRCAATGSPRHCCTETLIRTTSCPLGTARADRSCRLTSAIRKPIWRMSISSRPYPNCCSPDTGNSRQSSTALRSGASCG